MHFHATMSKNKMFYGIHYQLKSFLTIQGLHHNGRQLQHDGSRGRRRRPNPVRRQEARRVLVRGRSRHRHLHRAQPRLLGGEADGGRRGQHLRRGPGPPSVTEMNSENLLAIVAIHDRDQPHPRIYYAVSN